MGRGAPPPSLLGGPWGPMGPYGALWGPMGRAEEVAIGFVFLLFSVFVCLYLCRIGSVSLSPSACVPPVAYLGEPHPGAPQGSLLESSGGAWSLLEGWGQAGQAPKTK